MMCPEFRREVEEKSEIITEIKVSIWTCFMLAVFLGSRRPGWWCTVKIFMI